jgi:ABC-2 type transport system ATP-binding protein
MMLYIKNLTKTYKPQSGIRRILMRSPVRKEVKALDNVELQINKGEIFGLLGPNGAGKTSLIKIATTLLRPTSGSVTVAGLDVVRDEDEVRKLIGLVTGDERSFYLRLTGRQNLSFYAALCNIERSKIPGKVDALLGKVGLLEAADNMFYSYSSGMKQKLSIARALLNNPKILFLDEPTRSVDVVAIMEIKELIKSLINDDGERAVVLATHRLEEAEELCDRVAIMNKGNIVFCGTAYELS